MSISKFATYINPLLDALSRLGGSARPSEVCALIAKDLALPDHVLEERLNNGVSKFENQVHWARFYLAKTGHLDASRHGVWALTEKGRATPPFSEEGLRALLQEVQGRTAPTSAPSLLLKKEPEHSDKETEEVPDLGEGSYREQLLVILKALPPKGFERLCQRLLREAGFEQVVVTGRSGDGGIDGYGFLQVNPLVSFKVLFQCKRYDRSVSPSEIRDFRGAMAG